MHARHRAPRRRTRTVSRPRVGLIALGVVGVATATAVTGLAGASESANQVRDSAVQTDRGRPVGVPQPARPATGWYSDWSSWGSGGTYCEPMALRWC
jgi:hypothetical protein